MIAVWWTDDWLELVSDEEAGKLFNVPPGVRLVRLPAPLPHVAEAQQEDGGSA
jgi:hypothetical protein